MVVFLKLSIKTMSARFVLAILCLTVAFLVHAEAKKEPKGHLQFVQLEYAKALSEYHRLNATVLHVRATGGNGKIKYSIEETGSPFVIDEKGHIWLIKALNSDENRICRLTIKAIIPGTKSAAYAKVRFDIMLHTPQFANSSYICAVTENTRKVSILPPIRIRHKGHSDAGKLKSIEIVEPHIPFKFDVSKDGGVEVVATENLDAEKETWYIFDIRAWTQGSPTRATQPAPIKCRVVDANEFVPEFTSDFYAHEVVQGKTYDKILQVEATDKDFGEEFGSVCKYVIQTLDVPFKLSDKGILSLGTPLGPKAPSFYAFDIAAVDCGGKMSIKSAHVRINVQDSCKQGIEGPSMPEIIIPQCIGKAIIAPDVQLNKCSKKMPTSNFSAIIHLETTAGKGCDRQQYEKSSLYKLCGASGVIDILPKAGKHQTWTKHLPTAGKEGTTFVFDGNTVAEIPSSVVTEDIGQQFTISTWIKTKSQKGKQIIIANTDKRKHNRIHFAIFKNKDRLAVIHRLEPNRGSRDDYCASNFHYKPKIFDMKWHHLTVVIDGCSVKLFVDGQHEPAHSTDSNYRMHKSHISTLLVVGGHWLAKEAIYTQHFNGALSGLTIRPKKPTSEQTIKCLIGCREHINIDIPLPSGFKSELVSFNTMRVFGHGKPQDFEKILRNIEYQNELFTPTLGTRKMTILTKQGNTDMTPITIHVNIERNDKPVITLKGCDDKAVKTKHLKEFGVPVCSSLNIEYKGCKSSLKSPVDGVKFLDKAVIMVSPPLKKGESLNFPQQPDGGSILDDLELRSFQNQDGIIIWGVANYKTYEQVLRDIVYVNLSPEKDLHHTFTISVSDQNGRFNSDQEMLELSILHRARKLKPFDTSAIKETLSAEELPGAVSVDNAVNKVSKSSISSGIMALIIIGIASVFMILVVLGVYRLRKSAKTIQVEATAAEKEEMYWDDTGLSGVRITVNPLQKFQELDLNEDNDSEHGQSDDEDNQEAKQKLEWDEGAL